MIILVSGKKKKDKIMKAFSAGVSQLIIELLQHMQIRTISTNAMYIKIPAAAANTQLVAVGVLPNDTPNIIPNRQSTEDNKL